MTRGNVCINTTISIKSVISNYYIFNQFLYIYHDIVIIKLQKEKPSRRTIWLGKSILSNCCWNFSLMSLKLMSVLQHHQSFAIKSTERVWLLRPPWRPAVSCTKTVIHSINSRTHTDPDRSRGETVFTGTGRLQGAAVDPLRPGLLGAEMWAVLWLHAIKDVDLSISEGTFTGAHSRLGKLLRIWGEMRLSWATVDTIKILINCVTQSA